MLQLIPVYFFIQELEGCISVVNIMDCGYILVLVLVLLSTSTIVPIQALLNKEDAPPRRSSLDLYFERYGATASVYDRRDPLGTRLQVLVQGQNFTTGQVHGFSCVVVPLAGRINYSNPTPMMKLGVLPTAIAAVEAQSDILSNQLPIVKTGGATPSNVISLLIHPE